MTSQTRGGSTSGHEPNRQRRARQRGAVQVEFALLLLPLLGFVMFIMDTAWVIFMQSTIQEAVREGVRVGVTAVAGSCGKVTCTVQQTVQAASFNFVQASNVQVTYYSTTNGTLQSIPTAAGADVGGNIIQVSVSNVTVNSLGAILRASTPITLAATASDVIENNLSPSSP